MVSAMVASRYLVGYQRVATVNATPGEVWDALGGIDQAASWSVWVDRIEVRGPDPAAAILTAGTEVDARIATPLAIRIRVRVHLDDAVPERLIVATVDGDLRGQARLELGAEGRGTRAEVSWSLEMMHGVMRTMALLSGPLLRWGHDLVAEATIRTFVQRLSASVGTAHGG